MLLRLTANLNRVLMFLMKNLRIIALHGVRNKGQTNSGAGFSQRKRANARLAGENEIMKTTNLDRYLTKQMRNPNITARFERAEEVWDVVLREQAVLSQESYS